MELYIFNRELEYQGIIESYTSFRWVRRYNKSGEFELHIALTPHSLKLLQRDNIIYKKDDDEAGFIEYRKLSQNQEGKELLVVTGKFLTHYLHRRIIWSKETLQETIESSIRHLVNTNCINTTDIKRKIDRLELGTIHNFTKVEPFQVTYANLLDEIERLSSIDELGFKTTFDVADKKLKFEIYKGIDKSINQDIVPRVVFSKDFENILNQEYVESINNYSNVALVGGMGEDEARKLVTVGDSSGLNRYETFVDSKSITNKKEDNTIISDEDYLKILQTSGTSKLAEMKELKTFDCKINPYGNLKYKQDYDLGDIVTLLSRAWGITIDKRIMEVEEVYEQDGFSINVTFGEAMPTLIDKIKQKIN